MKRIAIIVLFNVVAASLVFLVLEGGSSVLLSVRSVYGDNPEGPPALRRATRKHTQYDPLLGWINLPSFRADAISGPGTDRQPNSPAVRNDQDFPAEVPPERIRVICSGD